MLEYQFGAHLVDWIVLIIFLFCTLELADMITKGSCLLIRAWNRLYNRFIIRRRIRRMKEAYGWELLVDALNYILKEELEAQLDEDDVRTVGLFIAEHKIESILDSMSDRRVAA